MGDETSWFTLQPVLMPREGHPGQLYVKNEGGAKDARIGPVYPLRLAAGQEISTDTYFNTFYLSYWRRFTSIGHVGVGLRFRGALRLRIILAGAGNRRTLVDRELNSPATRARTRPSVVWPDRDAVAGDAHRLHVEIEALDTCVIEDIAYVTDVVPEGEVAMSVGLCTFNREHYLKPLLVELIAQLEQDIGIEAVYVVNQGEDFADAELQELADHPRLRLVRQGNLGGCGGFTRSMVEALDADRGYTHHLLLDDDIELDARVLRTVVSFLRYGSRPMVLGGQVLSANAPAVLFEAGANFHPLWFVDPVGQGTLLDEGNALDLFDDADTVDYNGWWFCVMPLSEIASAGLPPPVFIRFDDIEYCCRMAKRGVMNVSLPGVAVWHALNVSHASDWGQYYDMRNRLIISALHGEMTSLPGPQIVFGHVLECLLTHRYVAAELCMWGIRDFLLGPRALFGLDPAEHHRKVFDFARALQPELVPEHEALDHEPGVPFPRHRTFIAVGFAYFRRVLAALMLPYEHERVRLFDYVDISPLSVGNAAYIVTDGRRNSYVRYAPNRRRLFGTMVRGAAVVMGYAFRRNACAAEWRAETAAYQTAETWESLFRRHSI